MNFIVKKSTKKDMQDYCSVYARVRTAGIDKAYAIGFFIKQSEWESYIDNKYKSSNIMESIGIRYGLFANVLEQIRTELEAHFDPTTATSTIKVIKNAALENSITTSRKKSTENNKLFVDYLKKCLDDYENGRRVSKISGKPVSTSRKLSIKISLEP